MKGYITKEQLSDSLKNELNDFSSQLEHKASKIGVNLIDFKNENNTYEDALNEAIKVSSIINMPENLTITINKQIILSKPISIKGNNSIINYYGGETFIKSNYNIELENIGIYYEGNKSTFVGCIELNSIPWGNKIILDNVRIVNFTGTYLYMNDNYRSIIKNSKFVNYSTYAHTQRVGIRFGKTEYFSNCCQIINNTFGGLEVGISLDYVSTLDIDRNSFDSVDNVFLKTENLCENISYVNNWIEDCSVCFSSGSLTTTNALSIDKTKSGIPLLSYINNNHQMNLTKVVNNSSTINMMTLDTMNIHKKHFYTDDKNELQPETLLRYSYGKTTAWKSLFEINTDGIKGELPVLNPINTDKLNSYSYNLTNPTINGNERIFNLDLAPILTNNGVKRKGILIFNIVVTDIGVNDALTGVFMLNEFSNTYKSKPFLLGEIYDRWDKGIDYVFKFERSGDDLQIYINSKEFKSAKININFLTH